MTYKEMSDSSDIFVKLERDNEMCDSSNIFV